MNLKKQKQTKQTTRTGTEPEKWRSHGGLSVRKGRGDNGRKGTGNKKHKWYIQNRQGEVKNSMGNVEGKELIYMTHGHELRLGENVGRMGCAGRRRIKEGKMADCNSIINKIYLMKELYEPCRF